MAHVALRVDLEPPRWNQLDSFSRVQCIEGMTQTDFLRGVGFAKIRVAGLAGDEKKV